MKYWISLLILFVALFSTSQECRKTTVLFKNGKFDLKKEELFKIDSLLKSLHSDTTYLIECHGHSDERGSEKSNLLLSQRRVNSIIEIFRKSNLQNTEKLALYYGELSPASSDRRLNRRVNIFVRPINHDKTISIFGDDGVQMRTPVYSFAGCGYCLSNPKIKSTKPANLSKEGSINVTIETNCTETIQCYSVEFRFPYEYFNESSVIKMPRPIYVLPCGRSSLPSDSVDVKNNDKFNVRFDTLSNEYIVTHDCYNPTKQSICCGTRSIGGHRRVIILPSQIAKNKSFYYTKNWAFRTNQKSTEDDTLITEIADSFFLKGDFDTLFGYGYFNEELLFLKAKLQDLPRKQIYSEEGFYLYTVYFVSIHHYSPLSYSNTLVTVKLPLNYTGEIPGYYIKELDYFIPMKQIKRRRFSHPLLEYEFDYALKDSSQDSPKIIEPKRMRIHFKKRKAKINIKLKRDF